MTRPRTQGIGRFRFPLMSRGIGVDFRNYGCTLQQDLTLFRYGFVKRLQSFISVLRSADFIRFPFVKAVKAMRQVSRSAVASLSWLRDTNGGNSRKLTMPNPKKDTIQPAAATATSHQGNRSRPNPQFGGNLFSGHDFRRSLKSSATRSISPVS